MGLSGDFVALYSRQRDQTEAICLKSYNIMLSRRGRVHLFHIHRDLLVWDGQIYRHAAGQFLKMADLQETPKTAASCDNILVLGLDKNSKCKVYERQPNSDLKLLQTFKVKNWSKGTETMIHAMKSFPEYSRTSLFMVVSRELIRYNIEVVKAFQPVVTVGKMRKSQLGDSMIMCKTDITDF